MLYPPEKLKRQKPYFLKSIFILFSFLNQFSFSLRRCVNEAGGYSCDCKGTGYSGVYCTVDIDECDGALGEIRCKNGGEFH